MNKKARNICLIIALILLVLFLVVSTMNTMKDIKIVLQNCKENGWDGINFKSAFSNEVVCANRAQAEKDALGEKENE